MVVHPPGDSGDAAVPSLVPAFPLITVHCRSSVCSVVFKVRHPALCSAPPCFLGLGIAALPLSFGMPTSLYRHQPARGRRGPIRPIRPQQVTEAPLCDGPGLFMAAEGVLRRRSSGWVRRVQTAGTAADLEAVCILAPESSMRSSTTSQGTRSQARRRAMPRGRLR